MSDGSSRFEMTYQRGQILGRGASGVAFVVRPKRDLEAKLVAKEICVVRSDEKRRREALAEGKLLQTLSHCNIVQCLDVIQENDLMYIVMEYANGGDLSKQIQVRRQENKLLSEHSVMVVFVQICAALSYIHQKRILHRDLKPANIFIVGEGELSTCTVKLGDFGIAKMIECTMGQANSTVGTPSYLSPEICKNHPYGMKADVWSLGIVLYELICLKVPFHAGNLPAMALMICTAEPKPVPDEFGVPLADLAKVLLQKDPDKRPQVAALLQRPYVRSFLPEHAKEAVPNMPLLTRGMSLPTHQQPRTASVPVSRLPSCGPRERQRRVAPEQGDRPARLPRSDRGEHLRRPDAADRGESGAEARAERCTAVVVERHDRHQRACRSDRTDKGDRIAERGDRTAERGERLERQGVEVPRLGGGDHAASRTAVDGQSAGNQQPAAVPQPPERAERPAPLALAVDHRSEGRSAMALREGEHLRSHNTSDGAWNVTGDVSEICEPGESAGSWGDTGGEHEVLSPMKVRACAWNTASREPKVDSLGSNAKHLALPQADDEASTGVGSHEGASSVPLAQVEAPLPAETCQDPAPPGAEPPSSRPLFLVSSSAHDAILRTRPKRSRRGRRLDTLDTSEDVASPPPELQALVSLTPASASSAPLPQHHAAARSVSPSARLTTQLGPGVEVPVPPLLRNSGSAPSLPPLPPLLAHGAGGRCSAEAARSKSVAALHTDGPNGHADAFQPLQRGAPHAPPSAFIVPHVASTALHPLAAADGVRLAPKLPSALTTHHLSPAEPRFCHRGAEGLSTARDERGDGRDVDARLSVV